MPDVKINGVEYRLAEDAEGEHYSLSAEPLRPPNAVTVQGENSQKFQMRPDTLLWSLSDWSGGEGQQKFDPENGNRWRELNSVRAFDPPGKLRPGWAVKEVTDGSAVVTERGGLSMLDSGDLFFFNQASPETRKWNFTGGGQWNAPVTLTGPASGASFNIVSDGNWMYWHETGTNNIWKWNSSGTTATQIDSGAMPAMTDPGLAELGSYIYVFDAAIGKVWELPKTGTPNDVNIDDFSDDPGEEPQGFSSLVTTNGKVYALVAKPTYTAIREITPTTAAGAGFGVEIARLPGIAAWSMWTHSGLLYLGAKHTDGKAAIFYLKPGGEYGSLGIVRIANQDFPDSTVVWIYGGQQNGLTLAHYFVTGENIGGGRCRVWEIDAVTGNMASLAEVANTQPMSPPVRWELEGLVWSNDAGFSSSRRTFQADTDSFSVTSSAISPWNDFALSDEKILSSLVLSMEKLPADWQVRVDYAINGEDTWTNVIDTATTDSTGGKTWVSTDTSTVKFRTLSIRIRMDYTGAADPPTTGPTILGVDALAMVAKPTKVWRLLLDLSDDKSRGIGSSGSRQATTLSTAADTESVVAFKDYYGSHTPGEAEEHDVIIDSYALVLSTPGEGVAAVTLKETS